MAKNVIGVRLTEAEKIMLKTMAVEDYTSQNSVMRRLLNREAKRRGLLPERQAPQPPRAQSESVNSGNRAVMNI